MPIVLEKSPSGSPLNDEIVINLAWNKGGLLNNLFNKKV